MTFDQRTVTYLNREQRRNDAARKRLAREARHAATPGAFGPAPDRREQRIAIAWTVTVLMLITVGLTLAVVLR